MQFHPATAPHAGLLSSSALGQSLAQRVEAAYQWLCKSRQQGHSNHPVWHFRWNWKTWKAELLRHLRATQPSYRFSPVRRIATATGERLECWEPQDALVLKLLSQHLGTLLQPVISPSCHHLQGNGGVKQAVHSVKQALASGKYPYVARSDAKGYYASIRHTRLLELLREHCHDPVALDLVSQYCGRTLEQDGYYHSPRKGISLGCSLSPLMGALYLAPLDRAVASLPGIRYCRFMDDWIILAETRWQLRRAVRVMNQVLAHLGLEQHPDKTFIGRVARGFDFLGIDFQPSAPLAASAVSLARKTEKIARLYEQGASPERIGRYEMHWSRWLHSLLDRSDPAAPAPQARPPLCPTRRRSDDPSVSSHPAPQRWWGVNMKNKIYENKTDKDRSFRSHMAAGCHGPRRHQRRRASGHGADYANGQ